MITNTNPTNTMTINDIQLPIFTGAVLPDWLKAAEQKGFDFVGRVVDRLHFALRCKHCGAVSKVKRFTLMSAQPQCAHCIMQEWRKDAEVAGLNYLNRDEADRHYGLYRAPCGHDIRRQYALVKRIAAGETGLRCETCHAASEVDEALEYGWELLGPDCDGDPNYRMYRHSDCGHEQRMARANMQTGRHSCGRCGVAWPSAPSYLYAMSFVTATGRKLVKAGFSRNPESRLHHQLKRDPDMPCAILTRIAVPTGQQAILLEKRLHAKLQRAHPDLVVDPAAYRDQIRVASEIYDGSLTQTILDHLSEIENDLHASAA
jgi:hypothetical protein